MCLVTFNYDTMLEAALPAVGLRITSLEDDVGSDTYKVVKLHGSVHWGREAKTPFGSNIRSLEDWTLANRLIERVTELRISDKYRSLNQRPLRARLPGDLLATFETRAR